MTVTNTYTTSVLSTGNGVTTAFTTRFVFALNSEVLVYKVLISTGVETLQTITTHYTLAGAGTGSAGTVTFLTAPSSLYYVKIVRATAKTQTTDYVEGVKFSASTHEAALDKNVRLVQELSTDVDRCPKLPVSSVNYPLVFPDFAVGDALNILRLNSGGTALEFASIAESGLSATAAPTANNFLTGSGTDWVTTTPGDSRTAMGLGSIATQSAAAVAITGGSVSGITDLAIADGGTGASTAATARDNLGLGTLATQSGTFSGSNTGDQNTFSTIAVAGQSDVVADSAADTLTLVAGANVTITTNAGSDSVTIASAITGGSVGDGDYGDIVVSSTGTVYTIDTAAVTYAKMQDVSATDKILGRSTAGSGDVEEIACTATGRSILDDASVSAVRTTIGVDLMHDAWTAPTTTVGAAISFLEGTDNGTNTCKLQGPASTADVTVTLPASTGTLYVSSGTDVTVADGGTGTSTATAYAVQCGGTTSTNPHQSIASVGTADQVLTSAGAGALPAMSWSKGSFLAVTQASHGFVAGDVLYLNSTTWTKAIATSGAAAEVLGVVSLNVDTNNFVLQMTGHITGLSGLTAGTVYFLSPSSAGATTSTEPSAAAQISKPVYVATAATTAVILNSRGIVI